MKVSLEFKLQDMWMGVFWKRTEKTITVTESAYAHWTTIYDIWICIIPCLPIHIHHESKPWTWTCEEYALEGWVSDDAVKNVTEQLEE